MAMLKRPSRERVTQDGGGEFMPPDRPDRNPPFISDDRGMPPNELPGPGDIAGERAGTSPRENPTLGGGVNMRSPGGQATPGRPMSPTPMAGSVMPFQPMGSPSPASLTRPRSGNLYGSMGGLQGGGLGLPLDPTSNQKSDPISTLLQLLMGR